MRTAIVVVDDFYDDPDQIAERALALPYRREPGVNYPGVVAPTFQDVRPLAERFAALLGGISIKYCGEQGSFRITTLADLPTLRSIVHLDGTDYSAIVHLSRHPVEGTHFYRHKRLGIDYVTPELQRRPEVMKAVDDDTLDLSAWEVVDTIPMKFNRLVLFDGKHFHSGAQELCGDTLAEGRLTQNFFFHRA